MPNIEAFGFVVSEFISHFKAITDNVALGGVCMDPRCMVGRIYRVIIYIATHTILIIWVLWFRRRRFFLCFPIFNLGELYVVMETRVLA